MNARLRVLALAIGALAAFLLWREGIFLLNDRSAGRYPVRGVDVSSHQGEIDWPTLAGQDLSFAYIKATEGSTFVDPRYSANAAGGRDAGLRVGAYHFFSYDSPGASQAASFVATIDARPGDLPPAVDVEFYGAYEKSPAPAEQAVAQLTALVDALIAQYGVPPVLYATGRAYRLYIEGRFDACPIWIRDVFFAPRLPDGRTWTFWQYADRGRLAGYAGRERFIDLNVFAGSAQEFAALPGL
ncbi:MAG: hypothetical protein GX558_03950 [Clostridiales bacterium]|nr:hypothetical protein [Clostridiales bacterium]